MPLNPPLPRLGELSAKESEMFNFENCYNSIFSPVKARRLGPAIFLSANSYWVPTKTFSISQTLNSCTTFGKDKNLVLFLNIFGNFKSCFFIFHK